MAFGASVTVAVLDDEAGGWDPSAQSGGSMSEQVEECMDLEHRLHWLHLEPTHLLYYTVCTDYTWSPLTCVGQRSCVGRRSGGGGVRVAVLVKIFTFLGVERLPHRPAYLHAFDAIVVLVDTIIYPLQKVGAVSQSKSSDVWVYSTQSALATLGDHSP
jgi:hypothetical protein